MNTGNIYTWFWILYFPLCIAFYLFIGFDYIDEILTLCMIIVAIYKNALNKNRKIKKEIYTYIGIMTFYVLYSYIIKIQIPSGIWLDLQQQIRPYAVFYCTLVLAPQFTKKQKKIIITVMIICLAIYVIAFRGRIASITGGASESAVLGQVALVTAMTYYLWTSPTRKNLYISIAICAFGILGGKSKFFGEMVAFVALLYFLKQKINFSSPKFILQLIILVSVILVFTWTRFNIYYIDGFSDEKIGELARPATYATSLKLLVDYFPFGTGLGSFATHAAWRYYSPIYFKYKLNTIWGLDPGGGFISDAFYPVLAEFGIVGIVFFIIFWKRRIKEIQRLQDIRAYRIALMAILALALESTADSSYLSGKGMGYFMLLAICINSTKHIRISNKDKYESIIRR